MGCGQSVQQPAGSGFQAVAPNAASTKKPKQPQQQQQQQQQQEVQFPPQQPPLQQDEAPYEPQEVATSTTSVTVPETAPLQEHQLSDISSDDEDAQVQRSHSASDLKGVRSKSFNNVAEQRHGDEPQSMEDDFMFEYDGVVINTNACTFDARSKMAQSQKKAAVAAAAQPAGAGGGGGGRAVGNSKFSFGDFKVNIVDEIDEMPAMKPPMDPDAKQSFQQAAAAAASAPHVGGLVGSPTVPQPNQSSPVSLSPSTSAVKSGAGAAAAFGSPTAPGAGKKGFTEVRRFTVTHLLGHASRVKCLAIAPNEREYVSCSNEDASVTLFNVATGRESAIFTGHQDTVINATFSTDGKYLATTSRDHTMILWDVVTAKQILTFDHAKVVICCCFSKDSRYVATGCQDKVCRLWETRKGREHLVFAQHEGIVISMSYAPDNQHIVSASADKTLRVWSTSTAKCRFTLLGHVGIVLVCNYTSDGKFIISNDEKLLKVWNATDGSCTKTLQVEDLPTIKGAAIPPNMKKMTWTLSCPAPGPFSRYLFVACNNRFVYMLDIHTGEEVSHVFCKAPVYCLSSGHRFRVAFGDSFGNVYLVTMR